MASDEENKRVLTEVVKRQMAILGPDITIAKVRNVPGIKLDASGQVVGIEGDPQVLLSELINQFVELSGLIVKKTMESIIMSQAASISPQMAQGIASAGVEQQPKIDTPVQSQNPNPISNDESVLSANREIEDLNKMLNNLNTNK
jgi:hypothetical protein